MSVKTCARCKKSKSISDFGKYYKSKDGHWTYCKDCVHEQQKAVRGRRKERNQNLDQDRANCSRRCSDCKEDLSFDRFYRDCSNSRGCDTLCKPCREKRTKATRERNRQNFKKPIEGLKFCNKCGAEKPVSHFTILRTTADGLRHNCRDCEAKAYRTVRDEVLNHYSGGDPRCACCGESQSEFLSIDHIDGGGVKHRKSLGGLPIYRWLKREGFPSGFRLLCHNCNQSFGYWGYCPHQKNQN